MPQEQGKRDATAVLKGQIVLLASAVISQSLLAWQLAPAGRGTYALAAAYGQILPVVFAFALDRAVQIDLMSGRIVLRMALRISTAAVVCASSLAAVTLILLLQAAPAVAGKISGPGIVCALLLMPSALAFTFTLKIFTALKRFTDYLVCTVLQSIVNVALLLMLATVPGFGAAEALAALVASYAVPVLVSAVRLRSHVAGEAIGRLTRSVMTQTISFAARAYPTTVAHALDFGAATLFLGLVASKFEIGLMAATTAILLRFLMVPQSLQEALLPRVAADPVGRPELVSQSARIACAITFLMLGSFLLLSKPIIVVLLSPAFLPAIPLMWWCAPGIVLHGASTVLMPYFDGTRRPGVVSLAVWCGLVVNVSLIVLLYDRMGVSGAAVAFSVGLAFRFLILAVVFRHFTGLTFAALLIPRRADLAVLHVMLERPVTAICSRLGLGRSSR